MTDKIRKDGITRRDFVTGAAAGIGGVALMGLGPTEAKAQGKVIKWRMQSYYPSTASAGKPAWMWAKAITDVTEGRLTIECAEPGSIVPANEIFQNVSNGTLDAGGSFGPVHRGIMPEVDIEAGLPFAWEKVEECHAGFYDYGLLGEFRKIYAEHNIFYAAPLYCNIIYGYPTVKPVRKPADLKGMKFRDMGLSADWLAHYGAAPTSIPPGEMYMALKMRTIDGAHYGVAILEELKIGEVCKYYLLEPNTGVTVVNLLVSMKSFNALPADLKLIVQNYSLDFTLPNVMAWDENRSFIEISKKYGVEGVRWSKADIDSSKAYMIAKLWPKVAAKSARCKRLVDITVAQAKRLGKI